jgi:hypothetical protein
MQPTKYCENDSDCNPNAPCSSSCGKGLEEGPDFKESDARRARPVANQVSFERPVTNAVGAVAPRYDYLIDALGAIVTNAKPSGHCEKDSDCDPKAPGSGSCGNGEEAPDFKVGNRGILVKLLIAWTSRCTPLTLLHIFLLFTLPHWFRRIRVLLLQKTCSLSVYHDPVTITMYLFFFAGHLFCSVNLVNTCTFDLVRHINHIWFC